MFNMSIIVTEYDRKERKVCLKYSTKWAKQIPDISMSSQQLTAALCPIKHCSQHIFPRRSHMFTQVAYIRTCIIK